MDVTSPKKNHFGSFTPFKLPVSMTYCLTENSSWAKSSHMPTIGKRCSRVGEGRGRGRGRAGRGGGGGVGQGEGGGGWVRHTDCIKVLVK